MKLHDIVAFTFVLSNQAAFGTAGSPQPKADMQENMYHRIIFPNSFYAGGQNNIGSQETQSPKSTKVEFTGYTLASNA